MLTEKMTTESQKNDYLKNSLSNSLEELLAAGALVPETDRNGNKYLALDNEFLQVAAQKIKAKVPFAEIVGEKLILTPEHGTYCVPVKNIQDILKDLDFEINIDWSKKRTILEGKNDITTITPPVRIPNTDYMMMPVPCQDFDTREAVLENKERLACIGNLEAAKKQLEFYTNTANTPASSSLKPSEVKQAISKSKKMIELWQPFVDAWTKTVEDSQHEDFYKWVENRKDQDLTTECQKNELLSAINQQANDNFITNSFNKYMSNRDVYDLFKKYNVEITSDMDVFNSLLIADYVNAKERKYYSDFKESGDLEAFKVWLKDNIVKNQAIVDGFKSKKTGLLKSLSNSQRQQYHSANMKASDFNRVLEFVVKNNRTILEFIK